MPKGAIGPSQYDTLFAFASLPDCTSEVYQSSSYCTVSNSFVLSHISNPAPLPQYSRLGTRSEYTQIRLFESGYSFRLELTSYPCVGLTRTDLHRSFHLSHVGLFSIIGPLILKLLPAAMPCRCGSIPLMRGRAVLGDRPPVYHEVRPPMNIRMCLLWFGLVAICTTALIILSYTGALSLDS